MISAQSNASILAARGEATGTIAGSLSAAPPTDAEKPARLNADLSTRLDRMRADSAKFLNDGLSLKERLKGFSDFQAAYITWANAWEAAGFSRNRGFDQKDPVQANYTLEAGKLGNQVFESEFISSGLALSRPHRFRQHRLCWMANLRPLACWHIGMALAPTSKTSQLR